MGGRTGVETALRKPKHVRTMSFNAAAGMEPHSVKDFLLYRIPSFLTRELFPALKNGQLKAYTNPAAAEEFVEYVMAGGLRAVKEGLSIGNCSIRDKAAQLGELGIKTAIYGYRADAMIPIQESLEHSGHLVDLSAIFPYPEVGHLAPQIYPEVVGKAQLEIIDALTGTNKAARHKHLARTAMMSEAA